MNNEDIQQSLNRGAKRYFDNCRAAVPDFIKAHFRYPGAWATNRVAFGWDLLRAPANLIWAPVYALVCIFRYLLSRYRKTQTLATMLEKTPSGFTTQVQDHISQLIVDELLNTPKARSLREHIVDELHELYENRRNNRIETEDFEKIIEPLVQEALVQYQVTRTASADISNTLSCTILGAFAFKKFTPGGIGIGIVIAALLAEKMAASNFIFGEALGEIYYGWFPPEPSLSLLSLSLFGVMACLSVVAAFSGIVTDPIQARLGIHQKRLNKMLDALEKDFNKSTRNSFRPKDQFIARILDAFDMLKSSLI